MTSALGTLAKVAIGGEAPSAPSFVDHITMLGDADYPTGGTLGFAAAFKTLVKQNRTILGVVPVGIATDLLEYDITNDKMLARVKATGAERALHQDMSANTYELLVLST